LECLFRFYSYGLERKFRPELYKDFQEETLRDHEGGQLYGLEKFWAFIKYYRHANELHVIPKLNELLTSFKTIEDFKLLYTEDDQARRSRNPSTSSSGACAVAALAAVNANSQAGRRARTASEGEKTLKAPAHQQHRYGGRHSSGSASAGTNTGRGKGQQTQRQQMVQ